MRKYRNITVCVTPKIYRQARRVAAENDFSVSYMVSWFLARLPAALKLSSFPMKGMESLAEHCLECPHLKTAGKRPANSAAPPTAPQAPPPTAPPVAAPATSPALSSPQEALYFPQDTPSGPQEKIAIPVCEAVTLTPNPQQIKDFQPQTDPRHSLCNSVTHSLSLR